MCLVQRLVSVHPSCVSLIPVQGKEWLDKVRICLMMQLSKPGFYSQLTSGKLSCQDIMDYAFKSHPDCYVSSGFCRDIAPSVHNLYALFRTFDLGDIMSKSFVEQVGMCNCVYCL